jgi:hypothetical protein
MAENRHQLVRRFQNSNHIERFAEAGLGLILEFPVGREFCRESFETSGHSGAAQRQFDVRFHCVARKRAFFPSSWRREINSPRQGI